MKHHPAKKLVIITEKIIAKGVQSIIEDCGATGYTITAAGGKGSRNIRTNDRAHVVDAFANVKFEVIVADEAKANAIMDKVAEQYFDNYSGITYLMPVEVLRPEKF